MSSEAATVTGGPDAGWSNAPSGGDVLYSKRSPHHRWTILSPSIQAARRMAPVSSSRLALQSGSSSSRMGSKGWDGWAGSWCHAAARSKKVAITGYDRSWACSARIGSMCPYSSIRRRKTGASREPAWAFSNSRSTLFRRNAERVADCGLKTSLSAPWRKSVGMSRQCASMFGCVR